MRKIFDFLAQNNCINSVPIIFIDDSTFYNNTIQLYKFRREARFRHEMANGSVSRQIALGNFNDFLIKINAVLALAGSSAVRHRTLMHKLQSLVHLPS